MQILTFHLAASKSFLHWNEGHDNNLSTGLFLTIIICSRERVEALAAGGRGLVPAGRRGGWQVLGTEAQALSLGQEAQCV